MLGAHDLGDLPQHRAASEIDEAVGHAAKRGVRRQARRVVRPTALQRQHDLRDVAPLALLRRELARKRLRDGHPLGRGANGSTFALDRNDIGGLPVPTGRFGETLRDDLLAAKGHDQHRTDVWMRTVRGQRLVRHAHVRSKLPAAS